MQTAGERLDDATGLDRRGEPGSRRPDTGPDPGANRRWRRPLAEYTAAGLAFLGMSIGLWWHVWTGHPSNTLTCGCGDPSVFVWFIEWPAYALSHGMNPFFSPMVFHPVGTNLLSGTSVLAIGLPLVPVTLAFGPVAALNVALTATPAVTGLATFWLLRRWVRWSPAAFAGAVLYAFSPFVLSSLEYAHLMTAALAPVPLVVGCLEELLLRHRYRPAPVGIVLALLVTVQFFVSTEVLGMLVVTGAIGVVLLLVTAAVTDRRALIDHGRHAAPGLAIAALVAGALLAYPAWFALAGPAHLSGPVWPNLTALGGAHVATFVDPFTGSAARGPMELGGYLGKPLPQEAYIGWGLVAVAAGTLAVWRRDRRLWFLGAMAIATSSLMLAIQYGRWVPWAFLHNLPLGDNIIEQRFVAFTLLALSGMVAIGMDRASRLRLPAVTTRARRTGTAHGARRRSPLVRIAPGMVTAVIVFLGAVVPLIMPLAGALPYAVHPAETPEWFTSAGRALGRTAVVLVYPAPFSGVQSPMGWQAIAAMSFAQAGGSGPQSVPSRDGRQRAAMAVLSHLTLSLEPPPAGTPAQLATVRRAIRGWGVTTVVVPVNAGKPLIIGGRDPWYAAAFMTALLGTSPRVEDRAWVWAGVTHDPSPLDVPRGTLAGCAATAAARRAAPAVAPCVLAVGGARGARGA